MIIHAPRRGLAPTAHKASTAHHGHRVPQMRSAPALPGPKFMKTVGPNDLTTLSESADGQVNSCMMKAGPHTNPAVPASHRPPSPPRGNDRKTLLLSATSALRGGHRGDAESGCRGLELLNARDRVLSGTRAVASLIGRFLVLAFAVLYR